MPKAAIAYHPTRRVIAISGGTTPLGRFIIDHFIGDPRYTKIVLLVAPSARDRLPSHEKIAVVDLNLDQSKGSGKLANDLDQARVDTLVHLKIPGEGDDNPQAAHERVVIGTMRLLNACATSCVRKLIVRSAIALYGARSNAPALMSESAALRVDEDVPSLADKAETDHMTRRFSDENPTLCVSILRLAPMLMAHAENQVARYFRAPLVPVLLGYDPLIQLIDGADAAAAFKLFADADFAGVFNIAAPKVTSLRSAIALAGRIALPLPSGIVRRAASLARLMGLSTLSPGLLRYLRYPCIGDLSCVARTTGFIARKTVQEVLVSFVESEQCLTPSIGLDPQGRSLDRLTQALNTPGGVAPPRNTPPMPLSSRLTRGLYDSPSTDQVPYDEGLLDDRATLRAISPKIDIRS